MVGFGTLGNGDAEFTSVVWLDHDPCLLLGPPVTSAFYMSPSPLEDVKSLPPVAQRIECLYLLLPRASFSADFLSTAHSLHKHFHKLPWAVEALSLSLLASSAPSCSGSPSTSHPYCRLHSIAFTETSLSPPKALHGADLVPACPSAHTLSSHLVLLHLHLSAAIRWSCASSGTFPDL